MHRAMKFTDLIHEHHGVLSEDLCNDIIDRFRKDDRKEGGVCGIGKLDQFKISQDLHISCMIGWEDIDSLIYNALTPYISEYIGILAETFGVHTDNFRDTGYQMQWTSPGEYFRKHSDFNVDIIPETNNSQTVQIRERIITYILYLNDRKGIEDGRTIFTIGDTVMPIEAEVGKLVLFPCYPFYRHEGEPLETGEKFLITGWGNADVTTEILDLDEENTNYLIEVIEDVDVRAANENDPNPFQTVGIRHVANELPK